MSAAAPPLLHSDQGLRIRAMQNQEDGVHEFLRVPSGALRALAMPDAHAAQAGPALEREPTFTTWGTSTASDNDMLLPTTMPSLSRWGRARKQSSASVDWNAVGMGVANADDGVLLGNHVASDRALERAESGMGQHDVLLDSSSGLMAMMEEHSDGKRRSSGGPLTSLSDIVFQASSSFDDTRRV